MEIIEILSVAINYENEEFKNCSIRIKVNRHKREMMFPYEKLIPRFILNFTANRTRSHLIVDKWKELNGVDYEKFSYIAI